MTREEFKARLSAMLAKEQGEYPLDLRAYKHPYAVKDNEIFGITEMDDAYNFVKDSEEWFVDIYANTPDEFGGHADYVGATLWSVDSVNMKIRTAQDKFDARLKELGLWDEWCNQGCCGRVGVEKDDKVIILVHEDTDDLFTEFTYPPISEMACDEDFRRNALKDFCYAGDEQFIRNLVSWYLRPHINKCPLFPVDVYFLWNGVATDFEDDKEPQIMDCSNGHDAELVKRINKAWIEDPIEFYAIVGLLINRDLGNFEELGGQKPSQDDVVLFLMTIANERDFETILNFCRA